MSPDDDRARLAQIRDDHLYDVDLGRWDADEMWLLRMAEDGIAAREEAERLRALCDDDLRRHRVGRDVVDALVAERDAALAALRAVEAVFARWEGFDVVDEARAVIAEHYSDGVPSG